MKEKPIRIDDVLAKGIQEIPYKQWEDEFNKTVRAEFGLEIEIAGVIYDLAKSFQQVDEDRYHNLMDKFGDSKVAQGEWLWIFDNYYLRADFVREFDLKADEVPTEDWKFQDDDFY